MKRILSAILALLMIASDFVFFNILPVTSVSEKGICTDEDPIYFTAHRGVNAKAPGNSMPAYEMAVEMGFYSVETDVRLTKDKVWVICHDSTIDKWFNGKGKVSDYTFDEIQQFKFKAGHGVHKYSKDQLRMPTLEQYLDLFVGTNIRPQIEIKTDDYEGIPELLAMVDEKGLTEQALIISFTLEQLQYIRSIAPDMELWYLCGEITDDVIAEAKSIGGNVWLSCDFTKNTIETMQTSVDAGIPVSMWTVDSVKDAKKLYEAGFRYMETDRLAP